MTRLSALAATALSRMEAHAARHSASFEKVMIFPEGAFSPEAAEALRRQQYVAALNTHISAVEGEAGPSFRDIFEPALSHYHGFPIISRRYLDHGLENFAFDLLLGKPCLIATHHHDYRDRMEPVLTALNKLFALQVTCFPKTGQTGVGGI